MLVSAERKQNFIHHTVLDAVCRVTEHRNYKLKMPVLMADTTTKQLRPTGQDVDKLVEEVRERLCLKSREKLHAARRAMPYSRKGSTFAVNGDHFDSSHPYSHRARNVGSKHLCSHCMAKFSLCKCPNPSDSKDSPDLLKQLLAEHRLIQEAVRRIHVLQHQYGDTGCSSLESPSPCCVSVRSSSSDSVGSSTFSSTADL